MTVPSGVLFNDTLKGELIMLTNGGDVGYHRKLGSAYLYVSLSKQALPSKTSEKPHFLSFVVLY